MGRMIIRPAEWKDVDDLWKYTYEGKSREQVETLLKRYLREYKKELRVRLVAEVEGRVVARARFKKKKYGLKVHLAKGYGMYVNKDYRGRGIAGKLLDKAEEWMRENGAEKFVFTVRAGTVAEKVYRRREGYKEFGRLPGGSKRDGKYFDVIYMCKDLE